MVQIYHHLHIIIHHMNLCKLLPNLILNCFYHILLLIHYLNLVSEFNFIIYLVFIKKQLV